MVWARRQMCVCVCVLFSSVTAPMSCGGRLTLQEVEDLLHEQHSSHSATARFACGVGEGEWEYVCQVRYAPMGPAVRHGAKATEQRVGVKTVGTYRGAAQFFIAVLPASAPMLSTE